MINIYQDIIMTEWHNCKWNYFNITHKIYVFFSADQKTFILYILHDIYQQNKAFSGINNQSICIEYDRHTTDVVLSCHDSIPSLVSKTIRIGDEIDNF